VSHPFHRHPVTARCGTAADRQHDKSSSIRANFASIPLNVRAHACDAIVGLIRRDQQNQRSAGAPYSTSCARAVFAVTAPLRARVYVGV
jgi:hypothetical protein